MCSRNIFSKIMTFELNIQRKKVYRKNHILLVHDCEDDAWCTIQIEVVSLVLRNSWVAFTARVDDDTTITSPLVYP